MSHYTSYGTGTIEIDIENPDKNSSKPCCFFTEKLIYYAFTFLAFIALCIYFSYGHLVGNGTKDESSTLSQLKVIVGSKGISSGLEDADLTDSDPLVVSDAMMKQVVNCFNSDDDKSYDAKYGWYTFQDDVVAVIDAFNTRWDEYSQYVEDQTGILLDHNKGCFGQYLHDQISCTDECSNELGMDFTLNEPNICKNTFLNNMRDTLKPYRRACIASLLGYQFSDLCDKSPAQSAGIELASFNWWRTAYVVSSSWSHSDCPYYT